MSDIPLPEGIIRGIEQDGYRLWRGVPYAKPPIGKLRWKAPQPPEPWAGLRMATKPVPKPWQPISTGGMPSA